MRFRQKMMRAYSAALLSISTLICCFLLYFVVAYSVKQNQYNLQMATQILTQAVQYAPQSAPQTLAVTAHTLMSTGLYSHLIIRDAQGKEMLNETNPISPPRHWLTQQNTQHIQVRGQNQSLMGTIDITPTALSYRDLTQSILMTISIWILSLMIGYWIFRRCTQHMQGAVEELMHALNAQDKKNTSKAYLIEEFRMIGQNIQRLSGRLQKLMREKLRTVEVEHQRALLDQSTDLFGRETFINILDEYLMTPALSTQANYFFIQIEGFSTPDVISQGIMPTVGEILTNYCPRGFGGMLSHQPYLFCLINPNRDNTKLIHIILEEQLGEKIHQIGGKAYENAIRIVSFSLPQNQHAADILAYGEQALSHVQPLSKGLLCESKALEDVESSTEEHLDEVLTNIEHVLQKGQLALVVQPTYRVDRIEHKSLMGYELFSRIPLPHGDLMKASDFLPLLYQSHMGERLDLLVTELTIEALQLRPQEKEVQYAINFSPAVLSNLTLQENIFHLLRNAQLKQSLTVEFSEFSVLKEEEAFRDFLKRAQENGIRVALDQFGMQKKSLELLAQVQLQYVKIAPSLILNFRNESRQRQLIQGIVDIANILDTPVIAIGVDSAERLHQLIKLGISGAQGHLFGESKSLFYQRLSAR